LVIARFWTKQMQSLQVLDLNLVVREINHLLPRLIGEDIVLAPGKNVAKIKADPVQIEETVMNLAANARDAMPHRGKLTIETANLRLDESYTQRHSIVPAVEYVLLAVNDFGAPRKSVKCWRFPRQLRASCDGSPVCALGPPAISYNNPPDPE